MTENQEIIEAYKMYHPYKYRLAFLIAYIRVWLMPKTWKIQGLIIWTKLDNARLKRKIERLKRKLAKKKS